jgi:hypothetical protein
MSVLTLVRRSALLVILAAFGAGAPFAGIAEDAARVTTDTPAYCDELRAEVEQARARAASAVQAEVTALETEGAHLCRAGQVRGGIIRLRRALTLMHPADPSPAP